MPTLPRYRHHGLQSSSNTLCRNTLCRIASLVLLPWVVVFFLVFLSSNVFAATSATYEYDALGRLTAVIYDDGFRIIYTYDAAGNRTSQIIASGTNQLPIALDDADTTDEETVASGDVLLDNGFGADNDPDGDPLTVTAVNGLTANVGQFIDLSSGARVRVFASGSYTYNPNESFDFLTAGETDTDTFTYAISDGQGGADVATVTITINGLLGPPVAKEDVFDIDENTMLVGNLLDDNGFGPDVDYDGDTITVNQVLGGISGSVPGQFTFSSGAEITINADGSFIFDPTVAYDSLSESIALVGFAYTITDGQGGSALETVSITVTGIDDPPVAADDLLVVNESDSASLDVVADNGFGPDTDAEGDSLEITHVNGTPVVPGSGTIVALPSGSTVEVTSDTNAVYVAGWQFASLDPGESAPDNFTYTITDDESSATATVSVTVNGTQTNQVPLAVNDLFVTNIDTTLNVPASGVLANDTDDDGEPLTVSSHDSTSVNGGTVLVNADGSLDYTPPTGFDGNDSFTYEVTDPQGGSATATVTIDVQNQSPIAVADAVTTNEDTAFNGNVLEDNGGGPDSDPDGDSLTIIEVEGVSGNVGNEITLAAGGLLTVNADGSFDYDPNGGFETLGSGETDSETFAYTISDGRGGTASSTVSITIEGVNDAPVAVADTVNTNEDSALNGDVLLDNGSGADSDPEGESLTVSEVNGQANDVDNEVTLASGARLTLRADGTFTYDPSGAFDDLEDGEPRPDSFTYAVTDGSLTSAAVTVSITVMGINDQPIAVADAFTTGEDSGFAGNVLDDNGGGADSDSDGGTLTVIEVEGTAVSGATQITLTQGTLLTINPDGSFSYDPNGKFELLNEGETDSDNFTYKISDNQGGEATAIVTITIEGANELPVAVADAFTTDEDSGFADNVLEDNGGGADSDPDGGTLTVIEVEGTAVSGATQITLAQGTLLTISPDGSFSYDPNGQFEFLNDGDTDSDSFTYKISDNQGGEATATVTITINGVDDPNQLPVAIADAFTTDEDTGFSDNVLEDNGNGADSDPDGGSLTVTDVDGTAVSGATQITLTKGTLLTINPDGSFSYDPNGQFEPLSASATDSDSFTYTISDGQGGTASANVTITIDGANDSPVAVADAFTTDEDSSFADNVLDDNGGGADSDIDGGTLTVTEVEGTVVNGATQITLTKGTLLTINPDGSFSYDPNGQFEFLNDGETDSDDFTYKISDGQGGTASATVDITVNGIDEPNQPPVAVADAFTTGEDSGFAGNVLDDNGGGADSDSDGGTLTVIEVEGTAVSGATQITLTQGTLLTINPDGSFSYDPNGKFELLNEGETDSDNFTYKISDNQGGEATAIVTITIEGANELPVAVADAFTTDEDSGFADNVLEDNGGGADSDPDGGTLTVIEVEGTAVSGATQITLAQGTLLTISPDGSFSYDPNGQFEFLNDGDTDSDSFTYKISDNQGGEATAIVNITIDGVDEPAGPILEANFDSDSEGFSYLDDAFRNTNQPSYATGVYDPSGGFSGGGLSITLGGVNNSIINNMSGGWQASFDLAAATSVTVELRYRLVHSTYYESNEYSEVMVDLDGQVYGFAGNDYLRRIYGDSSGGPDDDSGWVSYSVNVGELAAGSHTLTLGGYANRKTYNNESSDIFIDEVRVTPTDPNGPVSLELRVSQGSDDVEEKPSGQILLNSVDLELVYDTYVETGNQIDGIRFTGVDVPQGATIQSAFIQFTADETQSGTTNLEIRGQAVDSAATFTTATDDVTSRTVTTAVVAWTPDPWSNVGAAGPDERTPDISPIVQEIVSRPLWLFGNDLAVIITGTGRRTAETFEGAPTQAALLHITYQMQSGPANQPPVAVADAVFTNANAVLPGNVLSDNGAGVDSDPDGDPLTVVAVEGASGDVGNQITLASGALLTLNSDGSFSYDPNGQFDPLGAGQSDSNSFGYTISDGRGGLDSATVTVTVDGVNDPPVAMADSVTTDEETVLSDNVLTDNGNGADSDPEGDPLTVTEVEGAAANVGNQITLASGALLTVNSDGSFNYDPNGQFETLSLFESVNESFGYTIADGQGGTSGSTVTIRVDGVNDPPIAAPDDLTTPENVVLIGNLFDDNGNGADSDVDGYGLNVFSVSNADGSGTVGPNDPITLTSGALLTVGYDGDLTYNPNGQFDSLNAGETATDSFVYRLWDSLDVTPNTTVTITITGVDGANQAPIAQADTLTTDESTPISGSVFADNGAGVDSDPDTDPLTVTEVNGDNDDVGDWITLSSGALARVRSDGSYDYDPNDQYSGLVSGDTAVDSFTYTIWDGRGGYDTATVTVTVNGLDSYFVANFDSDEDGFTYLDYGFYGYYPWEVATEYASGTYEPTAGFAGGGLSISLGGIDHNSAQIISGAWQRSFDVSAASYATLELRYRLVHGSGYESNEYSEVLVELDGTLYGLAPNDYLIRTYGDGNGGVDDDSGWLVANIDLGVVAAGSHTLTIGGFNNQKTFSDELAQIYIDEVSVTAFDPSGPGNTPPSAQDDAVTTDEDTAISFDVFADNGSGADSDPDSDPLTVTHVNGGAIGTGIIHVLPSGARLTTPPDGNFTYDPNGAFEALNAGETDTEVITYTITDGQGGTDTATATVTIDGVDEPSLQILLTKIDQGSDDAEEPINGGTVIVSDTSLDLMYGLGANDWVGLRFALMNVPKGAPIQEAKIIFTSAVGPSGGNSLLEFHGEATDSSQTFSAIQGDLSSRSRTNASVQWWVPPWVDVGLSGANQTTPDLSSIVQEIVDRPGYATGNPITFLIDAPVANTLVAESYEGSPTGAAVLRVEYIGFPPPGN